MKVTDILSAIEKMANPHFQANWDKSGMQVASSRKDIFFVGVFLDPTPALVSEAINAGADFLLCHHPLSLKPRLPGKLDALHEVLRLLLSNRIALYAAHTSLDVNLAGPAGWLGRELKLQKRQPLERLNIPGNDNQYGYGECGVLEQALNSGSLVEWVMELLGIDCADFTGSEIGAKCSKIAYCGGSGAAFIAAAKDLNADLYITGDIKYHAAIEAEIPVLDVGHHCIEEKMMQVFADWLKKELPEITVRFFPSHAPFRRICCDKQLPRKDEIQ